MEKDSGPSHYTKQPWWLIPLGGIVVALLPLLKFGRFQRADLDVSLSVAMLTAGVLGMAAAAVLVVRSHIRSNLGANLVLWIGILFVAIGACVLIMWMSP
jgi:hypothetical protein